MKAWRWIEAGAIYVAIAVALAAGLAASYGREREAQRTPDRHWWLNRVLILPLLAIMATTATEAFSLSTSMAAFTAAMLSLGGYDALRLVENRWRAKIKEIGPAAGEAQGLHPAHRPTGEPGSLRNSDPRTRPLEMLRDILPLEGSSLEEITLVQKIDRAAEDEEQGRAT